MSTAINKFAAGGLPMGPNDLLGGLENVNMSLKSSGGSPFLRLLTDGIFVYGADNTEVEEGSNWAVNPYTIQHGFACWDSDKSVLLDEVMVPMSSTKPLLSDLPDLGHDWRPQVSVQLQCVSGEDEGVVVLYKGTSKGQSDAIKALTSAIISQIKNAEPFVPVVTLDSTHYSHKKHGRTYTPVIEVVAWSDMEGVVAEPAEEIGEVEKPEKPATKTSAKKIEPVEGKEPVKTTRTKKEEVPTTRRRRRASS